MNTIENQGKPASPPGILRTLASNTSLEILALLQGNSCSLSGLARRLNTTKSVAHRYIHRLSECGFLVQGGPQPTENLHAYFLAHPWTADATGLYAKFNSEDGLLATGVAYCSGAAYANSINLARIPPLAKAQSYRLRATAENILPFFHSETHMATFANGFGIMAGADSRRHKVEQIVSAFGGKSARLEVRFADRSPIILERDFSKPAAHAPVRVPDISCLSTSR